MEIVLRSLRASSRPSFAYDDVHEIDPAGPDTLVELGIMRPAEHLPRVRCDQCPEECFIDVDYQLDGNGEVCMAFGFCPDPGEGSRLIKVDPVRLKTWRVDASALAQCVCKWLGFGSLPATVASGHVWRLGDLKVSAYNYRVFLAVGLGSPSLPASVLESLKSALEYTLTPLVLVPCDEGKCLELLGSIPTLSLASLLCSTQGNLALDADGLKRHLSALRDEEQLSVPPGFVFSPDYRTVCRLEKTYSLSEPQAQVIALLHKAWADKYVYLHYTHIIKNITTSSTRLQDVFKDKEDVMRDLLVSNGSGGWALNVPEEK